jgi:Fe-S-cluster-containing dehydrogenase component
MKKCNLCYDRTAQGLKPWCAQACPTQALWYGDFEQFAAERRGRAVDRTRFGTQEVRTRVYHVLPRDAPRLDVQHLLDEAEAEVGRAGQKREEAWVL